MTALTSKSGTRKAWRDFESVVRLTEVKYNYTALKTVSGIVFSLYAYLLLS